MEGPDAAVAAWIEGREVFKIGVGRPEGIPADIPNGTGQKAGNIIKSASLVVEEKCSMVRSKIAVEWMGRLDG